MLLEITEMLRCLKFLYFWVQIFFDILSFHYDKTIIWNKNLKQYYFLYLYINSYHHILGLLDDFYDRAFICYQTLPKGNFIQVFRTFISTHSIISFDIYMFSMIKQSYATKFYKLQQFPSIWYFYVHA